MKRISTLVVLAAVGLAVAGCGSARKGGSVSVVVNTVDTNSPSGTIYVTGKKTFAGLPVGTPIACKGQDTIVTVPSGETEIAEGGHWARADATHSTSPTTVDLKRSADGKVTVACGRK